MCRVTSLEQSMAVQPSVRPWRSWFDNFLLSPYGQVQVALIYAVSDASAIGQNIITPSSLDFCWRAWFPSLRVLELYMISLLFFLSSFFSSLLIPYSIPLAVYARAIFRSDKIGFEDEILVSREPLRLPKRNSHSERLLSSFWEEVECILL